MMLRQGWGAMNYFDMLVIQCYSACIEFIMSNDSCYIIPNSSDSDE